jgi:nucleoside-diphosphate-sugar epimerase
MTAPEAGGQRYMAANGTYTMLQLGEMLRSAFPDRAGRLPRGEAPDWLVRLIGPLVPEMRGNMAEIGTRRTADAEAAKRLLGRPFIPIGETVVATARSAIARGLA